MLSRDEHQWAELKEIQDYAQFFLLEKIYLYIIFLSSKELSKKC